jgi:hypothetical protein
MPVTGRRRIGLPVAGSASGYIVSFLFHVWNTSVTIMALKCVKRNNNDV